MKFVANKQIDFVSRNTVVSDNSEMALSRLIAVTGPKLGASLRVIRKLSERVKASLGFRVAKMGGSNAVQRGPVGQQ